MWKRRLALEIASQLPERRDDALAVLQLTRDVLDRFLCAPIARTPVRLVCTDHGEEEGAG